MVFTRLIAEALLMRISIPPKVSTTFWIHSLTLYSFLISHASGSPFPPAFTISSAAV